MKIMFNKEQKFNVQLKRTYIHPHRGNTLHYTLFLILLQRVPIPKVLVRPVVLSQEIALQLGKEIKKGTSQLFVRGIKDKGE